jgi:hypothetical protein
MGTVLRERDSASEAVAALLDSARTGRGGVLFVEGDAGLGKSTSSSLRGNTRGPTCASGWARATRWR